MKHTLLLLIMLAPMTLAQQVRDCSGLINPPFAEATLCGNTQISALDDQLEALYQSQLENNNNPATLQQAQQDWIDNVRNRCDDLDCLVRVYRERITALGGKPPKQANFMLYELYEGNPLCQEYLTILNQTPLDELKACRLPDLSGSPIQPVQFTLLQGEDLKTTDKILYEQMYPTLNDWEQQWPGRKQEYDTGTLKLGDAYWDLDKDGENDRIIQMSWPSPYCSILSAGEDNFEIRQQEKAKWLNYSLEQKMAKAQKYGYQNIYLLLKNRKMSYVRANNFVTYQGEHISIDQGMLAYINSMENATNKNLIQIWGSDNQPKSIPPIYKLENRMCQFWLNN